MEYGALAGQGQGRLSQSPATVDMYSNNLLDFTMPAFLPGRRLWEPGTGTTNSQVDRVHHRSATQIESELPDENDQ